MAVGNIPVHTCDRCGEVGEMRRQHDIYSWGKIHAHHINGPFSIGSRPADKIAHADLCPLCTASLQRWWKQEKPHD